jgi:hypothetical protein
MGDKKIEYNIESRPGGKVILTFYISNGSTVEQGTMDMESYDKAMGFIDALKKENVTCEKQN